MFTSYYNRSNKNIGKIMKILIQCPVRNRFKKFCETFELYYIKSSGLHDIHYNISIDSDDKYINEFNLNTFLKNMQNISFTITTNPNTTKIQAINQIPRGLDFDILILFSDDMIPQINNYDDIVVNDMKKYYPDLDGVLWYFDGYQTRLNTLCILGKKYYNRFGYIYNPEYISFRCDDEFRDVGNILNKQTFINKCIIKHEHFSYNKKVPMDELYKRNEAFAKIDATTYAKRKQNNFYIK